MKLSTQPTQLPLGLSSVSRTRLENFIAGANGPLLRALHERAPALYLHGAQGTGKTHLLQAACRQVSALGERALYLPLTEMVAQPPDWLQGLEHLQLLALDDVQALAGQRAWQQALVALLDRLRVAGAQLLFAASVAPQSLQLELADLSSRLGWAVRYRLQALDDEGRQQLLTQRAAERGLELNEEVARYLLQRSPRSTPRLLALLDELDAVSLVTRRHLTIPLVRQVLQQAGEQDAD